MKKLRFTKKEINQHTGKRHQFVWCNVKSYEEKINFTYEENGPYIKIANLEVVLDSGFESTNYIGLDEYTYETWDDSKKQWVEHDPYKKIYDGFKEWRKHCWVIYLMDPTTDMISKRLYEKLTIEEIDDFVGDMSLKRREENVSVFESPEGDLYCISHEEYISGRSPFEIYKTKEERNTAEELDKARKLQRFEKLSEVPLQTSYVSKKKK